MRHISTAKSVLVATLLLVSGNVRAQEANLARGQRCLAFSSVETDGWSLAALTDGKRGGLGYSSKSFAAYADHRLYPEYVVVDLGRHSEIDRVVLHPRGEGVGAGKGFPEDFTIAISQEGEPWQTVLERRGFSAPVSGAAQTFSLTQAAGRYVKVEATRLRAVEDGAFRFQLSELEVFGRAKAAPPLTNQTPAANGTTRVAGLRCEHYVDPAGVDVAQPRLEWIIESSVRSERQTAYRIVVATSQDQLGADRGDLWDSGKVESDQSVGVRYAGRPLKSGQYCCWKVMAWDKGGRPVPWSAPASFITGKLSPADWQGQWIGTNLRPADRGGVLGFACEATKADDVKWVQLDLGSPRNIDRVVLHPMVHDDPAAGGRIKGYAFPLRFRVDLSDDAEFKTSNTIADQTQADYPNPGHVQVSFAAHGRKARHVRLTVTRLWHRGAKLPFVYTLGEIEVFCGGRNVALHASVAANSSVEGSGWSQKQLTDGKALSPAPSTAAAEPAEQLQHPHGAIYLRKEITFDKPVRRATACFCGLGFSEFSIDGVKVGNGLMTPGFTTYDKRVQYLVHDVTERLATPGRRTLGVVLVDGWYALAKDPWGHGFHDKPYVDQPKLRLDLHVEFADGSATTVVSDPTWNWSQGAITRSWLCEEDIDLREGPPGWERTGFDDSAWKHAVAVPGPAGRLVCQREALTRVTGIMKPQTLVATPDGRAWLYDFGREFTGALRFRTTGPAGTQVKLTVCSPVGSEACAPRVNTFTLAGKGREEYAPRFCYNAISRVTIEGLAAEPTLEDLSAVELSGVAEVSGEFRCSNDLLNWLHDSARRTHKAYVTYLPNDPTREFKAWMEDPQNMFCAASHLYDSRALYERWQHDMLDVQREDGNGANVAPGPVFDGCNSTWWGGCLVWVPWHWYLQFGDPSLLFESYEAMKRYVDYLSQAGQDHIQDWGLRDWVCVEHTPPGIVNTPAYYLYAQIVSRTAQMLGRTDDVARYAQLAELVREKFNQKFLDPATGIYGPAGAKPSMERWWDPSRPDDVHEIWWSGDRPCTQAGQTLALALGLVPDTLRPRAEAALVREIAAHKNHVSTGFVATPYLLQVLADLAPELGYAMTATQDYPSWYSMTAGSAGRSKMSPVDHDLMQEGWSGRPALMPSLGGNIAGWHMQALGGIRPDPSGPGFKKILIKPNVVGDLHWVDSWYDSVHGRIVSNWRRRGEQLVVEVTIPANTSATVYVPAQSPDLVTESGQPTADADGLRFLRMEHGRAVYEVGSGSYRFLSVKRQSG